MRVVLLKRNDVITQVRPDTEETGRLVMLTEVLKLLRKRQVRESVTIIGEKFCLAFEVLR